MRKSILLAIIAFFIVCAPAAGHAIQFETEKHPPVVRVKSFFSPTSPVADANVTIYAPGENDPHQSGYTDKEGFFAFTPDRSGEWRFEIDDGMGHADRITVKVSSNFFDSEQESPGEIDKEEEAEAAERSSSECVFTEGIPVIYRVIFGLALILGVTGIIYGVKAKQAAKNNSTKN